MPAAAKGGGTALSEPATSTSLPAPAIDPADVQAILPEPDTEQAKLAAQLATAAVEAVIWPNPIPDPAPPPIYAVLLGRAACASGRRSCRATRCRSSRESIGSYSYRLAHRRPWPGAFGLTASSSTSSSRGSRAAAAPTTLPSAAALADWPADWWQRNLDNVEAGP